jgi:hypothetical protein
MKSLLLVMTLALVATTCPAQHYLPLSTGNFWTYRLDNGSLETRVVGAPVGFHGRTAYPIEYVVSPSNLGLVNYWSLAPGGGVLLHGFTRAVMGAWYEPPLLWVEGELADGQTWTQQSDFYILPSGAWYGRWDFGAEVLAEETLTVPAGDFVCFGLRNFANGPPKAMFGGAYDLSGQVAAGKSDLVEYWVSRDVGIVEEQLDDTYRLEGWFGPPVAVSSLSWGAVKALFRD